MRKLYALAVVLLACGFTYGQTVIKGQILDETTNEPLIGASVVNKATSEGTVTDIDGSFVLNLSQNTGTLVVSYLGFKTIEINLDGSSNNYDFGNVRLKTESVGLQEIYVISDVARDRRTPVAVSNIKGEKIEALIGNQEFPEMLKKTPSVYVTKLGGGFGDSRINVRGFNQRNVAVMINGIPVNDMENGWVYWSNWAGLSDVTSRMQVQRGLGASKLAAPNVGGSINIITNAAEFDQGGTASVTYGNDNYLKAALSYSTGLSEKGWAATFQATHTRGDGYVDGTAFRAYSYFASISKTINDQHQIAITGLGAPQWHHQRLGAGRFDRFNLRTYYDPDNTGEPGTDVGIRWNSTWGFLDGEEFNWRRNFYHKPKLFINHYWTINDKTDIKTSAYYSPGRGGGTGPRGRINNANPADGFFRDRIFDSFEGFGRGTHDINGLVRFDDIVRYNQGQLVDGFGQVNSDPGTTTSSGDGFIRRASMNSHNWMGVLSTMTTKLSENLNFVSGFDYRYYKGIHYRRVENLLGNTSYLSRADDNNPRNLITEESPATFGNFVDNSYRDGNNVLNYWNDGLVNWFGLYAQVEYVGEKATVFASVSGSNQGFKRIDYFNYLENDSQRETDWENFLGGTIKAGFNYNINRNHNFFVNAGFYSRQPIFDNVYINFVNEVNPDIENQKVYSYEGGYGYRGPNLNANLNLHYTLWTDRQFDRFLDLPNGEDGLALFRGVGQRHTGVELEFSYLLSSDITINGMASLGNWVYSSDFTADVRNLDTQQPAGTATIFADGLRIDDAAQTTFNIGATYDAGSGFRIYADYSFFDHLYAQYDIQDEQFLSPGGQVIQLPNYGLMDAGASYNFDIGDNRAAIRFNINNVLNTKSISESFTNIPDDPSTPNINEIYDNRGFFGFGTTWNTSFKVWF